MNFFGADGKIPRADWCNLQSNNTFFFICTRFLISPSVVKCSENSVALISYANICTKMRQRKTYGAYARDVIAAMLVYRQQKISH